MVRPKVRGALVAATIGLTSCALIAGIGDQFQLDAGTDASNAADAPGDATHVDGGGGDGGGDLDAGPPQYADVVLLTQDRYGTAYDLAVDDDAIYWVNNSASTLSRVRRDGGVEGRLFPALYPYRAVGLDETQVFLSQAPVDCAEAGVLNVGQKEAGASALQASSCAIRRLVAHGDWLYGLAEVPGTGSATTTLRRFRTFNIQQSEDLVTGPFAVRALVVDDGAVYLATATDIVKRSLAADAGSGTTSLISGESSPYELALDGAYLYWASSSSNAVRRARVDGTAQAEVVAPNQNGPDHVIVADGFAVWSNIDAQTVMRAPIDGSGTPEQLASGTGHVVRIASDARGLYWANAVGGIFWLPRK